MEGDEPLGWSWKLRRIHAAQAARGRCRPVFSPWPARPVPPKPSCCRRWMAIRARLAAPGGRVAWRGLALRAARHVLAGACLSAE
jgi:hypothetical protein